MVNEDKKYVVLCDSGQVAMERDKELVELLDRGEPLQSVFSLEEIKRFKNMETYELVPVDFSGKEQSYGKRR